MKIDRKALQALLTRDQGYFTSCWFNMVHEHSLDSHRVRIMNPQNALRELIKIHELGKPDERKAVRAETLEILKGDPILKVAPFVIPTSRLVSLLSGKAIETEKDEGPVLSMIRYSVHELQHFIGQQYVKASLASLKNVLVDGTSSSDPEPMRFAAIRQTTCNLLSTLLDQGSSLESLFAFYGQILIPRVQREAYFFARRLAIVSAAITSDEREFMVVFALDNVSSPREFPPDIAGINFSQVAQISVLAADPSKKAGQVRQYLTENRSRLFASLFVKSQDPRAAGAFAVQRLSEVLNLVRFEYERARVTMPDTFASQTEGSPARIFPLPMVVPNPNTGMDGAGLAEFVKSVEELVTVGRFNGEGKDRISSAFRLYRTGLDSAVHENKLLNWWTALEFLVRGNGAGGSIGTSVENLVTPVLCVGYLSKHLIAYRNSLVDLDAVINDPITNTELALKNLAPGALYELFKRADIQPLILNAAVNYPFLHQHMSEFLSKLQDPKQLASLNSSHEQRLRWQLQRLWRARCDIVHSADRKVNLTLLCANLEYYLKTILMVLLRDLRVVSTLSSPKEFFDRQEYCYQELQSDLRNGNDDELRRILRS